MRIFPEDISLWRILAFVTASQCAGGYSCASVNVHGYAKRKSPIRADVVALTNCQVDENWVKDVPMVPMTRR